MSNKPALIGAMFNGLLLQQSKLVINHPCIAELQYWKHRDKDVYLVSGEFDIAHFELSLYGEFGITAPDQLRSAIKKRQAEYLMGRLAAKHALSCIEFADPGITIAINEHRAPIWPLGIVGSIAHDKSTAMCVIARESTAPMLGVDIECLLSASVARQISSTVHDQQELALFQASGFTPNIITTLLFSAKESLFKALYPAVQCYFGFEETRLHQVDHQQQCLVFRLQETFASQYKLERYHSVIYHQQGRQFITLVA